MGTGGTGLNMGGAGMGGAGTGGADAGVVDAALDANSADAQVDAFANPCTVNNGGCDAKTTCTVGAQGAVVCGACPTGGKLKAMEEDAGSVLDNTVIYWCSGVASGADRGYTNTRTFLLGGCGGFFKTGQYIKFNNEPHNKLMVSLMRAMGISDATQFGDSRVGTGPLPGLG